VSRSLVSVAVPVPALDLLTYLVPPDIATPVAGARVVVPLGRRTLTGVVLGDATAPDGPFELREIGEVLDTEPFLPADVVQLASWVADYYVAGPGAALSAAMPPHALDQRVATFRTVRLLRLTAEGLDVAARLAAEVSSEATPAKGAGLALGARQRECLLLLNGAPDGLLSHELRRRGITASVVTRLKTLGLVTVQRERVERDPFATTHVTLAGGGADTATGSDTTRVLSAEQDAAVQSLSVLAREGRFQVALLRGVTGSGKTEVYLRLAEIVRRSARGVIMLVPEIALTPAVATAFRQRFGARVAVQHSGLSDGERHDQWHRIRRGDVDMVVGTRSAIFAPLANPGLIIVDEEHDTSYKQEEMPRYHGRDVAIMRGKFANALVLLGSATPSLESGYNAQQGRYAPVTLAKRVLDRPLAAVRIVNMRDEFAADGPDVILSRPLREAMAARLERREQVLILLNRRGFAAAVFCRQCGHTLECPNCSVSLTVHGAGRGWRARCHYCNHARIVPSQCVNCAAPYLEHVGFGTERIESEVATHFPGARIGRVDRDTIRRRGSLADLLSRFARRELDVLVGTQMIAKGHDFPDVTLVGVISADVGLGLADFRAAERTFQLLTQVAGRAGRGEQAGEAIIQTLFPGHYSIRHATSQDYDAFFAKELEFRRGMRYPPVVAMINVIVRGKTYGEAMEAAADLSRRTAELGTGGFVLLGPAPAPLTRLRGEHRVQFFLKGTSRAAMRVALKQALTQLPEIARRAIVDVDPMSVL
jgi:primosomal protein N' (replication factor Y)